MSGIQTSPGSRIGLSLLLKWLAQCRHAQLLVVVKTTMSVLMREQELSWREGPVACF